MFNSEVTNAADFVKIGHDRRKKSVARDAKFFQALWASRHANRMTLPAETSVTYSPTPSPAFPSTSPTPSTSPFPKRSLSLPCPPVPQKLARFVAGIPDANLHAYRTPAEWRDCSEWLQALYWHHAADELGYPQAFTLNLNAVVEERARRDEKSAASHLQKRIAKQLRKSFGRAVDFWFVLENARDHTTGRKRLHMHGEILVTAPETAQARAAMRIAAGEWIVARQHQASTKANPDEAWIGYCMKANATHNKRYGIFSAARGFNGKHYAVTTGVSALAKTLYDADRETVVG